MTKQHTSNKTSICVFCGAQNNVDPRHLEVGRQLGTHLAEAGYRMVFGGGDCGMMGAVADAAMESGGEVIGVFPEHLKSFEAEHTGITETIIVGSMHERKKMMFDLSDAFAILPGGFGTMDEMFEILTWRQIGLHDKPVFIFNHLDYWDPLLHMMQHIIGEGFAKPVNHTYYTAVQTLDELIHSLQTVGGEKKVNPPSKTVLT